MPWPTGCSAEDTNLAHLVFMAHYSSESVHIRHPLTVPRIQVHRTTMVDTSRPSRVRVFGKSLYVLAGGWLVSVVWLWIAGVRQYIYRFDTRPDDLAWPTLVIGIIPAVLLAMIALWVTRLTGGAATARQETREWQHAFWWSLTPILFVLATVYVMVAAAS